MRLHEFEELWPKRHELDDSLRQKLERLATTDKDCKNFVENGEWIRGICREIEPETVPADFAYRMQVYASNHMDDPEPAPKKSWMRWPAIVTGLAAGSLAMYIFVAPMMIGDPANSSIGSQMVTSQLDESTNIVDSVDLASVSDSLASEEDSTQIDKQSTPQPNWDIRTVSTEQ